MSLVITVPHSQHKKRLDSFLAHALPQYSRTFLKTLITKGCLYHQEHPLHDPNYRVQQGHSYRIQSLPSPDPCHLNPCAMHLSILYEDEDLLILEKPNGLVVHPAEGTKEPTLVHGLLAHCGAMLSGLSGMQKPGIVHRLDKDTSGLMVVAKTDTAHRHLADQFSHRLLTKIYWAFVKGHPHPSFGHIHTLMGPHPQQRHKRAVLSHQEMSPPSHEGSFSLKEPTHFYGNTGGQPIRGGRIALSVYRTLKHYAQASLLECRIYTGRTHQIRVHCAHIGHPLLGDALYGDGRGHTRQALHAAKLALYHPRTKEWMTFQSSLPNDLQELQAHLDL